MELATLEGRLRSSGRQPCELPRRGQTRLASAAAKERLLARAGVPIVAVVSRPQNLGSGEPSHDGDASPQRRGCSWTDLAHGACDTGGRAAQQQTPAAVFRRPMVAGSAARRRRFDCGPESRQALVPRQPRRPRRFRIQSGDKSPHSRTDAAPPGRRNTLECCGLSQLWIRCGSVSR